MGYDIVCAKAVSALSQVTLVHQDMRHWDAPVKADVMVSELLGSFGCNELSPECLDGAQRFLAEDGICIPQKYTNYLQPISTVKVHDEKSTPLFLLLLVM